MKKRMLVCLSVLFFFLVATPMYAQYVVKPGETLSGIASKNKDSLFTWNTIYNANQKLHEPGRRYIDGKGRIIVKIFPGEVLQGVNQTGVVVDTSQKKSTVSPEPVKYSNGSDFTWLLWLIGVIGLLSFCYWRFYEKILHRKNPTAWRPIHREGIQNENMATLAFETKAGDKGLVLIQGSQSKVRLSGIWLTQHRGLLIPVPHTYKEEKAYRARFRKSNGVEQIGYMLQACANDVHSGKWYIPFKNATVLEGWGEEATPIVPETESGATPVVVKEEEDGAVRVSFQCARDGKPARVQMTNVDETKDWSFEIKPGTVSARFTSKHS